MSAKKRPGVPEPDAEPLMDAGAQPDQTPESADTADAVAADLGAPGAGASDAAAQPERFARLRRLASKVPIPRPKTKRGAIMLILGAAVAGFIATMVGYQVVEYTESTSFCTLCHTMIPQKKAHEASTHSEVECGSCHVAPGVVGFVSAKLAGTRELYALVTNTYPRPIPAIEHSKMPATEVTCQRCHTLDAISQNGGPSQLVLRATFARDETNTRRDIAVLLRPANAGTADALGVHWHVTNEVKFTSSDEHLQTIDSVEFKDPKTGQLEQYIAVSQVRQSNNTAADIERLKATQQVRTMDCMDCHNRVGHAVPSADKAVDEALAAGKINSSLPYIKRNAVALLTMPYSSADQGLQAVNNLSAFYQQMYPDVARSKSTDVAAAAKELSKLFDEINTPHMNTGTSTWPDNLGHQNAPGCFRCHDGAHFKVVNGVITKEPIPSTCNTCHTFPQIASGNFIPQGATQIGPATSVPVGEKPADHNDNLWTFNHRNVAGTTTPNPTTCGSCHTASYCSTCHDSGAIKVDHYKMLYNHAQSVRDAGGTKACAVCHQPSYCDQCHKGDILGPSNSHLDKPAGG